MKKNILVKYVVVFAVMSMLCSGCSTLREKFVRKSKEEENPIQRYQPVRKYDVHPSLELYTKRYIYWKQWHRDLLEVLTDANKKKKTVAVEQEISNLVDMQNMVVEEKIIEMQPYIDELTEISNTIKNERVTGATEVRIRRKLESVGRQIKLKFSYTKMRGFISADFRSEREY